MIKNREALASALAVDEIQLSVDRVRGNGGHAGRVAMWVADQDPYIRMAPLNSTHGPGITLERDLMIRELAGQRLPVMSDGTCTPTTRSEVARRSAGWRGANIALRPCWWFRPQRCC